MIADAANTLDAASTHGYLLVLAIVVPVGGVLIATAVEGEMPNARHLPSSRRVSPSDLQSCSMFGRRLGRWRTF